ncbi:helicase-related protein [Inquilinus sp. OTU3971]|uniref:helicase-related protein n=1 Tax=Inquilinus sp. OTU3971 TaxID=3043855 RepID=UPI00313BABEC
MNADNDVKTHVSSLLSFMVDGAEHSGRFQAGDWDGRSSFFAYRAATFPAGFLTLVHQDLVRKGHTVQLVKRRLPEPLGKRDFENFDSLAGDPRYDYQPETVRRLLRYGSMIAQVATGGGKSRIARMSVAAIRRTTLFITTRAVLMHQMKEGFEKDGHNVGVIGDGELKARRGVNVAMVQTLMARLEEKTIEGEVDRLSSIEASAEKRKIEAKRAELKELKVPLLKVTKELEKLREEIEARRRKPAAMIAEAEQNVTRHMALREKTIRFLEQVEFVIGEEAHEAGGNSYYEILRFCKNAAYRLALTATPFMRADAESNMRLMACFGPIGIVVSEKMLIDRGILATPYFKYVSTPAPAVVKRSSAWQRAYKFGIVEAKERNRAIAFEAIRAVRHGLPVMILVQRKDHGAILEKALRSVGIRVRFIYGEHENDVRKDALGQLRSGELQVLIGSTILDVGIDVPAVGMVILAGGGKAEVALRQRIGRGLREKKGGVANICFIVDFTDTYNGYLKEHAMTRRQIVESTPGFVERIIAANDDLPYHLLAVAPAAAA